MTMVSARLPGYFNALEWLYGHPWLQKLTLRVLHIFKMPFDLAVTHLDSDLARKISYQVSRTSEKLKNFTLLKCFFLFARRY